MPDANPKDILNHWQQLPLAFRALLMLLLTLFISFVVCTISVIIYMFLLVGKPLLGQAELVALLDTPSTQAFQILMNGLAYLVTLIWCINQGHDKEIKSSLRLGRFNYFSLIESSLLIISYSVLIDQSLYLIAEALFPRMFQGVLINDLSVTSSLANVQGSNTVAFNLLLFLIVIFNPILEELFFRGFLWKTLRNNYSFLKTLLINAAAFAFIHLNFIQGINAFLMGLIYGFIAERSKSVWPCLIAHLTISYMTYLLSQKGVFYGLGGTSYPQKLLLSCSIVFIISFVLVFSKGNLFETNKSSEEKN